MSTNSLSYVNSDFDSIVTDLINRLKAKDSWKDTYESSTGTMLIELVAYIGDMLLFNVQRRAEESYIDTAKNLSSVINLVKLLGYTPKRKTSSTGTLRFTLSSAATKIVYIPKYTICQASDGTKFLTNEAANILVSSNPAPYVDVSTIQGELITLNYISDGTLDQKLIINDTAVEDSASTVNPSLNVYIDGVKWTKVDSFILSENTSTHYEIEPELDGTIGIIFGDNIAGKAPSAGSQIVIKYVKSDGAEGNVYQTSMITTLNSTIYDEDSTAVTTISVSNTTLFLGGDDEEGIEEIRYEAPRVFATGDRAVTKTDFIAILESYAGVENANVWGELEVAEAAGTTADLDSLNKVYISLLLQETDTLRGDYKDWGLPSATFKTTLSTYLRSLSMIAVKYEFIDPTIIDIVPVIDLIVTNGYSESETQEAAEAELLSHFTLGTTAKIGTKIKFSEIISGIHDLDEVSYLNMYFEIRKELTYDSYYDFTETLDLLPILPLSCKLYDGTTLIANDDGNGNFTFVGSDYAGCSGTIAYDTGIITVDLDVEPTDTLVIRYQQDEDRNLVVDFNQICKIYSIDWNSVDTETE